ncbi:MAG: sigma 54-interacting transcriptional regulator [Myxococcales bacterium]|nr:sigma 54-interacting transcriptional regulator [Myxococcales bacterium]
METILDRYEVVGSLGSGGTADVLAVRDRARGGQVVALKRLRAGADRGADSRRIALLDEYLCLAGLRHPNLPQVHDFLASTSAESAGPRRPAYTLERVLGDPVDTVVDTLDAPLNAVVGVGLGLLRALATLHGRGLIHGDLHPSNLLVDGGVAATRRALGSPEPLDALASLVRLLDLTPGDTGAFGALPFVAPERLEGAPATPASDLYSVGVILHRLATGVLPFPNYPVLGPIARPERLGGLHDLVLSLLGPASQRPTRADRVFTALARLAGGTTLGPFSTEVVALGLRSAPFVETQVVTAAIRAVVAGLDATADGATLTVIRGPAGAGKSRLLFELELRLRRHPASADARIARVSALPGDGQHGGVAARLADLLGAARSAESDPAADGRTAFDDAERSLRMAVTLAARRLLEPANGLGPRVLLIDDADRLGDFDRRVLSAVLVRARASRLPVTVILAAAGPIDMDVADGPAPTEVSLTPFTARELEALITGGLAGHRPSQVLVARLEGATGGLPGLAVDALAAAHADGLVTTDDDALIVAPHAPNPLPLPATFEAGLSRALSALPAASRAWVAVVANAPAPVPEAIVAATSDTALADAGRAVAFGLLRQVLDGTDACLVVANALVGSVARDLSPPTALWNRLADIDEEHPCARSPLARATLADAALHVDDSEARRAVAAARGLLAQGRGAAVVAILRHVERVSPLADPELLGDALASAGDIDGALSAYERLPASERARGSLLVRRGRYAEAVPLLEAAFARNPNDINAVRGLVRATLLQNQHDAALGWCDQAERLGDLGDPRVLFARGLIAFYRGNHAAAAEAFSRADTELARRGELVERANVKNAMGLVHHRRAELDDAVRHYEEALALATRSGDTERSVLTLMNLATVEQSRGHATRAEARYKEALTEARSVGHRSGAMKVLQNLGNLYRSLGDLDAAKRELEASLAISDADQNVYMSAYTLGVLGEVAGLQGALASGQALLERSLAGFLSVGSVAEAADVRVHLAATLLERGDFAAAKALAEASLAATTEPPVPPVQLAARLQLAEVARVAEPPDLDAALEHARAAEALADGLTSRPDARARTLTELHRVLRDRGDSGAALDAGLRALAALEGLAEAIPDSRRAQFLAVRPRRRALAELTWLRGITTGRESPSSRLQRLLDVNQRLSAERDPDVLIEYIIDSAILLTGAERGFLLLKDGRGAADGLEVAVARNIDQENIKNKKYKVSYSIAQRVVESGDPVLTTDAMGDDRYSQYLSIHHLKLRSVLCVPLHRTGFGEADRPARDVIGALYVDNRFQTNAFSAEDLSFMQAFGDQAAIALGNARLLDERRRALDELARSQAQVQALNQKLTERLAEKERVLAETEKELLVVQRRAQQVRSQGYEAIIGESTAIRAVFHILDRVRESDIPVLVTGESGTGKELVARAIHGTSPRKDRAFIAINCSSIPESLIESELFGHVRGAFTGATSDKKGVFEAADKGTLFLDEIGEMPVEMQAKMLRALQEGEIQKVGSPRPVKVDVRIVAATNRSLREMVAQKTFREDLFYRLAVVTLELPSLRERIEDLPILVAHFIEKNKRDGLGKVSHISPEAMRLLVRYRWPGNVRELETVIKNASIFCETDTLIPADLSNFPGIVGAAPLPAAAPATEGPVRPLADLEREAITHALELYAGNKKRAAEELGIDRRTLYNKISMYGIAIERRAHQLDRDD